jgi:hypothetical protein
MAAAVAQQANVLVIAGADTPELQVGRRADLHRRLHSATRGCARPLRRAASPQLLEGLPEGARVVHVGQTLQDFAGLSPQDWASVNVLLNCGVGKSAGTRDHIKVGTPALCGRGAGARPPAAGLQQGAAAALYNKSNSSSSSSSSSRCSHPTRALRPAPARRPSGRS